MKGYEGKHAWLRVILLGFLFFLPVGGDVIVWKVYFSYLCQKDTGNHIYETVTLGPEHWNDDGSPKFHTKRGDFDEAYFDGQYVIVVGRKDKKFTSPFNMLRSLQQIIDTSTNRILAERVKYLYWGGWVWNTWQPFRPGTTGCPTEDELQENPLVGNKGPIGYRQFDSYIFVKNKNTGDQ